MSIDNPQNGTHETPDENDRLIELMIQRSTSGLSESEQKEFDQLAVGREHHDESERFDLTAAALDLGYTSGSAEDEMPRGLQDQLLLAAGRFFGEDKFENANLDGSGVELLSRRDQAGSSSNRLDSDRSNSAKANRFSWREAIALAVTAACLMLLLSGFNPFAKPADSIAAIPTPAQLYNDFTTAQPPSDIVNVSWTPVHTPNASGKVAWSDDRQEGYMVFEGLPINDPTVEQYQLWIFDTDKAQKHPVDGGVFDITASGEVIVPIDAKIEVAKAVQFAVTVENPGGVVVSDRERIPVLAAID